MASNRGRAQARRGYAAEKRIEKRLAMYGFSRVPLSGAAGGRYSADLQGEPNRTVVKVEIKHRDSAMKLPRKWLAQGQAHLLVLDEGAVVEPLAILELSTLERLLWEAGYVLVP